jgi:hypothetical protein
VAFSDFLPQATHGTTAPPGSTAELFDFEPGAVPAPETASSARVDEPPAPLPRAPGGAPLGARSPATGRRGVSSLLFPDVTLEPPEPVPPLTREPVLTRALLVVLLALLAANVWTLVVGWSSQSRLGSVRVAELAPVERVPPSVPVEARPEHSDAAPLQPAPEPVVAAQPEGFEALELASRALERGEFERARRALFSLLCVADRLEPAVREDVIARASFLIGDAFHAEARAAAEGRP